MTIAPKSKYRNIAHDIKGTAIGTKNIWARAEALEIRLDIKRTPVKNFDGILTATTGFVKKLCDFF